MSFDIFLTSDFLAVYFISRTAAICSNIAFILYSGSDFENINFMKILFIFIPLFVSTDFLMIELNQSCRNVDGKDEI